jgi:hypothetical protein
VAGSFFLTLLLWALDKKHWWKTPPPWLSPLLIVVGIVITHYRAWREAWLKLEESYSQQLNEAHGERDDARGERDDARGERDDARGERDKCFEALLKAERERDALQSRIASLSPSRLANSPGPRAEELKREEEG